jgi:hypothetical protein
MPPPSSTTITVSGKGGAAIEIWIDPADNIVKAVYSDTYTGSVWSDLGYVSHRQPGPLAADLLPGAVVDPVTRVEVDPVTLEETLVLDRIDLITPAPPPPPREQTARELREAEIAAKLRTRTATLAEVQEFVLSRAGL